MKKRDKRGEERRKPNNTFWVNSKCKRGKKDIHRVHRL